jgi:hypothetical protein
MNIKVIYHIMPWEIDYALLSFTQFKKSKYYLSKEDNVTIETVLNLSSYIINWDDSKLPKQFFIDKYNEISNLLIDYNHIKRTYDGNELYGHLNLQKECTSSEIDYYIGVCPDMYFSEHLLAYMIEGAKSIKNEYFIITPQISKLWDNSWDVLVNPIYNNIPYGNRLNSFEIINNQDNLNQEISLQPINCFKYAGWFDLYSKSYVEDLAPIWDEWKGKGGWDTYSMNVSSYFKQIRGDVQQYVLEGQTIYRLSYCKNFENFSLYSYYKNNIKLNNTWNSRDTFDENISSYIQKRISKLGNLINN